MKKIKKLWWLFTIIVLGAILIWWFTSRGQDVSYSTVVVKAAPLVQTVNESGTLKPVREVSLNFLSAGRIQDVKVEVGDKVEAGMELASLDNSALQSRKLEAEAGLQIAEASLSKTLAGASNQTVAVSQAAVSQARASVESAKIELEKIQNSTSENVKQAEKTLADLESDAPGTLTAQEQAVSSASTVLENTTQTANANVANAQSSALININDKILSAKIALDNINTILEDKDAENVLSVKNSSLLTKTKDARVAALALVAPTEQAAAQASLNSALINQAVSTLQSLLNQTSIALDYTYAMLEATITSSNFSQANLDAYKTLVSSQSSQINAASVTIENSAQAYNNAILNRSISITNANEAWRQAEVTLSNAIVVARNNLNTLKLSKDQQIASAQARLEAAEQSLLSTQAQLNNTAAPARSQDVALVRAQVSQAQASLAGVEQQLSETVLVAPLDGVVTAVNYEIGEQFGAGGEAMIVILVNNSFKVEVDIAESNISKIKIGDVVDISFDAFPDDLILKGEVNFIEPARTLIQDVVYYKVEINFKDLNKSFSQLESQNLTLKAGMTTNVIITTDQRDNVLQIPARSVLEEGGRKFVRVLENGEPEEREVVSGLRGDDGLLEIISGLKKGDLVVTFIRNGE